MTCYVKQAPAASRVDAMQSAPEYLTPILKHETCWLKTWDTSQQRRTHRKKTVSSCSNTTEGVAVTERKDLQGLAGGGSGRGLPCSGLRVQGLGFRV